MACDSFKEPEVPPSAVPTRMRMLQPYVPRAYYQERCLQYHVLVHVSGCTLQTTLSAFFVGGPAFHNPELL